VPRSHRFRNGPHRNRRSFPSFSKPTTPPFADLFEDFAPFVPLRSSAPTAF
jgi:hypothetical protein